jgi:hypothetical protein
MQPKIHLESKPVYLPRPHPALLAKCIVGCICNSFGVIITRESPCMCEICTTDALNVVIYASKGAG